MDHKQKQNGHFDASLPLPDEAKAPPGNSSQDAATDLIRKKVEEAYHSAPAATAEVDKVNHLPAGTAPSKHQQFIDDLINSGKSLPEIQDAWHEYYAGLTDKEKNQVWQEFYSQHEHSSHYKEAITRPAEIVASTPPKRLHKRALKPKPATRPKKEELPITAPLRSLAFGLGIGFIVLFIFMFSFFNERFIAPFIQPSRSATSTPIITDSSSVSKTPEIIIPKINVEIPVIYTVKTIDADAVENALESGVVHYADTALPGQDGNGVIVGHSSNNIFNKGKYKFAFVLLSRLSNGDTFYLQKGGVRYTYQVYKKSIVSPTDVSVLGTQDKPATFTLITCDPPGTSTNRLVVVGEQISPSVKSNVAAVSTDNTLATKSAIIPGNSPSLWSRLVGWL